jgi:hypothetical protein
MMASEPEIAGYTIERLLGRGGMARVYLATQRALDRRVAVKVLDANAAEPAAVQRFEQEARLIAKLSHPHIVGVYDIGRTASDELYYAMPYLPEGDLRRRTLPLASDDVARLLGSVLDALEHAHTHGVIHRDIKPENILFDALGRPLLADFGVAFSEMKRERVTTIGFTVGSAGYMSPEQARGHAVDGRADLYGVGVLAYELLTGELPFTGPDTVAIAIAQFEQPIPRLPSNLLHWQAFIDRALQPQPSARFETARTMREALPTIAAASAAPSKSRNGLIAAIAALLIAAAGLGWWTWQRQAPSLAALDALLGRGDLAPPIEPNALSTLRQWPERGRVAELRAREQQLVDGLAQRAELALTARDWVRASDALTPLIDAANEFGLSQSPRMRTLNQQIEAALKADFTRAIAAFERRPAEAALGFAALLPGLSGELDALRELVVALPNPGGQFREAGLELTLLKRPQADRSGLAVTAQLLSAEAAKLAPFSGGCVSARSAQTCIQRTEALKLAQSFSTLTSARYRLPTITEWEQARGHFSAQPLAVWTDSCEYQTVVTDRPNALERGAGKIRSLFGGREARPQTAQRCVGFIVAHGDGKRRTLTSSARDPNVGVVLIREIQPRPAA